ncbi:MAG: serine hydrolase domain-containing protein [Fimbriimonas sp.]
MADRLTALVQESLNRTPVVGLSVLVACRGEILVSGGAGFANAEFGVPMTSRTLSRAASVTKIMTALLVMRLVERGRLYIDLPLQEVIPGIRDDLATATIRDLLCHRTGLPSGMDDKTAPPRNENIADFIRDTLPSYPLGPRGTYCYSNPGYAVLGRAAEIAGDAPYLELIQREVFDPLGMTNTTFEPSVALTYACAASHDEDGKTSHRFFDYPGRHPAGFAFSHVEDLRRLGDVLLGKTDLIRPETLATMTTPQADCGDGRRYGLGVFIEECDGRRRVGHTGHILGYASRLDTAPEIGVTVAMLFNQSGFRDEAKGLADRLIGALA